MVTELFALTFPDNCTLVTLTALLLLVIFPCTTPELSDTFPPVVTLPYREILLKVTLELFAEMSPYMVF